MTPCDLAPLLRAWEYLAGLLLFFCDSGDVLQSCLSPVSLNIPILEQIFDQFNQELSLIGVDRHDVVYIGFHMRTDIAHSPYAIDCSYAFF